MSKFLDTILKRKNINKTLDYNQDISNALARVSGVNTGWQWGLNQFQLDLNTIDKEKAYNTDPIIFKGINKKSRDMIFHGFEIDCPLDGIDIPENIEHTIRDFLNQQQIIRTMYHCIKDALWKGDGWFEWNCSGNKDPQMPLTGKLNRIEYIDTKTITGWQYLQKDGKKIPIVEYWKQQIGTRTQLIHASRIEHICFHPQSGSQFGISPIEIAQRAIQADINATKSLGDNLDMFGHPFPTVNTTDNINTKQVDDAFKLLSQLRRKELRVGFAGFKDTKFNMLNPATPNPDPALQHFYIQLSCALEMPMLLLTGSQMSKLTGNEIELDDYYKSIKSYQNIYLTPIYNKMFILLLGPDKWKPNYNIEWNQLYVNEESEIANKALIMEKIGDLYSKHGLIDIIEGRQLLRKYDIGIPENNPLDQEEDNNSDDGMPYITPPINDEEGNNENTTTTSDQGWTIRRATPLDLAIARHQRKIGEQAIKEGRAK